MCRRTTQSLFRELGERGKLELFDTLQEIRALAELDDDIFADLRGVLFGSDSDPWPNHPHLDAESAGILLEVMRDLLYQTFVRKARLKLAMSLRKSESASHSETGVIKAAAHLTGAPSPRIPAHCGRAASSRRPRRHSRGAQEFCIVRNTRSGCGMTEVTRPSALHTPATPAGEPLGLYGIALRRLVAIVDELQTHPARLRQFAGARARAELRQPSPCATTTGNTEPCMPASSTEVDRRHLHRGRAAPRIARSGCARTAASRPRPG